MALVQQNIRTAFQELGANVSAILRAHQGNTVRINEQKWSCLQFLANIQLSRYVIPPPTPSPEIGFNARDWVTARLGSRQP